MTDLNEMLKFTLRESVTIEQIHDAVRNMVTSDFELRELLPRDLLAAVGEPGLFDMTIDESTETIRMISQSGGWGYYIRRLRDGGIFHLRTRFTAFTSDIITSTLARRTMERVGNDLLTVLTTGDMYDVGIIFPDAAKIDFGGTDHNTEIDGLLAANGHVLVVSQPEDHVMLLEGSRGLGMVNLITQVRQRQFLQTRDYITARVAALNDYLKRVDTSWALDLNIKTGEPPVMLYMPDVYSAYVSVDEWNELKRLRSVKDYFA